MPRGFPRYFNRGMNRGANRGDEFTELGDFFPREWRIRGSGEHAQNFSAPSARRKMAFPLRCFIGPERLLRVSRENLGVGARSGAARIDPVKSLAHAPRQCFFTAPDFGFVSIF
jgi:hypothetical protein